MTRKWLEAGEDVFADSVVVDPPFSESGFFQASEPAARSYRFLARDGQVLSIEASVKGGRDAEMFLDLFVLDDGAWEVLAWADSALMITHEFSDDSECLLRVQPGLLADVWYSLRVSVKPALDNPVFGASNRSIGSFFGAPRDKGKRSHEGVDIFAPKGTPVIAPADGYISRVGTNRLGGKVVWMRDRARKQSYYFAHLDSQLVRPGMEVSRGHVLGLVGNTGNARYTPPHLHFGIYQSGSKDPLYYIHKMPDGRIAVPDTAFRQQPFKVRRTAVLHTGPSAELPVRMQLERNTYVTVLGESGKWYRVRLPDERQGYLEKARLVPIMSGKLAQMDSAGVLLSGLHREAIPVARVGKNAAVEILASFENRLFVRTREGKAGWL